MKRYLAFDIEISRELPDGVEDWKAFRPLGISCAAALAEDEREPTLFFGRGRDGAPSDQMTRQETAGLVTYLQEKAADGYTILTWNGLGFDFDILAEESGLWEECRNLALDHVDMMFHAFCGLGYGISLDRAAKTMGLAGKTEGMNGALAPRYWAQGRREEVLDYVAQDVRTTLELALVCEEQRGLRWTARSGRVNTFRLPNGWLTTSEAERLPEPDTSWMSNPWPREKFMGWTQTDTV